MRVTTSWLLKGRGWGRGGRREAGVRGRARYHISRRRCYKEGRENGREIGIETGEMNGQGKWEEEDEKRKQMG